MNDIVVREEMAFISGDDLNDYEIDQGKKRLFDMLLNVANCGNKGIFFHDENGGVFKSYKSVFQRAKEIAAGLKEFGLKVGDKVVFQLESPEDFLCAFWGCVFGGYVPVLLPVPFSYAERNIKLDKLQSACSTLDVSLILTDSSREEDINGFCAENNILTGLKVKVVEALLVDNSGVDFHKELLEAFKMVILTSGSTGSAKSIILTCENLIASFMGKKKKFNLDEKDVFFNWMPLDHVSGIIEGHLLPLFIQSDQVQTRTNYILASPLRFLDIISQYSVSFAFVSNFIFSIINNLVEKEEGKSWDLSFLRVLISGGEPTVNKSARKFLQLLSDKYKLNANCIVPGFGMSETCAGIVFSDNFSLKNVNNFEFANLGYPMPGVGMRIVDESNKLISKNEVGRLQVAGEVVITGYYNQANEDSFVEDGWFDTGDLGYIGENGLMLTGRKKDSVIINGVNYSSQELEGLLGDIECLDPSALVVCATRMPGSDAEQMVVFFGVEDINDDSFFVKTILEVKKKISQYVGAVPVAVIPIQKNNFPRTSIGKTHRSVLRNRFENGEYRYILDEVAERLKSVSTFIAPGNDIEKRVRGIWSEVLGLVEKEISIEDNFFDLGGSSLKTILLKSGIDRTFKSDIPIVWIFQYPTIKEFSARALDEESMEYFPLIPLQTRGDKSPLFFVHPGVGDVLVFVEFAKRLRKDRPFYGIRARGFNMGEEYFSSFEEMVDCYVSAILTVQQEGPYYIAGYSYGGAVAFEIAKKLETLGKNVAFIGVLNLPPYIAERLNQITYLDGLLNLLLFVELYTKEELSELRVKIKNLTKEDQLAYVIGHAPKSRLNELSLDTSNLSLWVELAQSMIKMGRTYNPSGNVNKLSIFHAIPLHGTKREWMDKLEEWDKFSRSANDYYEVSGHHYTLMGPKHVVEFTRIFQQAIDDAS